MSVHGTADFAERDELVANHLILPRRPGEVPNRLMIGFRLASMEQFEPIQYGGDLHQLIVGGTGGGKSRRR